jgi:hypothetical protein
MPTGSCRLLLVSPVKRPRRVKILADSAAQIAPAAKASCTISACSSARGACSVRWSATPPGTAHGTRRAEDVRPGGRRHTLTFDKPPRRRCSQRGRAKGAGALFVDLSPFNAPVPLTQSILAEPRRQTARQAQAPVTSEALVSSRRGDQISIAAPDMTSQQGRAEDVIP